MFTLSRDFGTTLAACVLVVTGLSAGSAIAAPQDLAASPNEAAIVDILDRNGIVTAGMGVIRDGTLVWEQYFGEQSPGVPATAGTRFNVASVTKTVTAETVLRLTAQGRISLDEPMAAYWTDPQIAEDPRRLELTPRMALNHTTGFPNWRFLVRGGRLGFEHAPGQQYGYSGEGMEYVARFAARKLDRTFPELVEETVFGPLGMDDTSLVVDRAGATSVALSHDDAGGIRQPWCRPEGAGYCRPEGSYSAADDMVTTVRDYAVFLRAVVDGQGYGEAIAADRDRVQTDKGDQSVIDCAVAPTSLCPDEQGYGLGFNILRYGDTVFIGHGGADWSELAIVYVSRPTRDGVIIFLNAPNSRALAAMPEVLAQIDPASPFLPEYRRWLAEAVAREAQTGD